MNYVQILDVLLIFLLSPIVMDEKYLIPYDNMYSKTWVCSIVDSV